MPFDKNNSLRRALAATHVALVALALLACPARVAARQTPAEQKRAAPDSTAAAQAPPFTLPAASADKFVTVGGAKIRYTEAGRGGVVILLHGLGGDATHWGRNILPLAARHRVIALDQIGFGRSDKPAVEYRAGTLVEALAGFMDALKIERASLVGNSMGGWIAAAFALRHPDRVERLVLADAIGLPLPADFRSQADPHPTTVEATKTFLSTLFYDDAGYAGDRAAASFLASMKEKAGEASVIRQLMISYWRRQDVLGDDLGTIRAPTLIVWGRDDELIPLRFGQEMNRLIPGSRLLVFDACGHLPQIERAAEFNIAVARFLSGEKLSTK